MSGHQQQEDFLDIVPDPHVKEILRKQINDVAFNDKHFQKRMKQTKQPDAQFNLLERNIDINALQGDNNDNEDYEGEDNPYKRNRNYQFQEPERYKKIGYQGKVLRRPIYRMTDLYLPANQKVQNVIDNIFKQKIQGRSASVPQLETHFDNTQELGKIFNNWEHKQDYYEFEDGKNDLNEQELEEVVVNLGDKKENYFLLIRSEQVKNRIEELKKKPVKNLPINNPNFIKNLKRMVTQLAQKNRCVEQFESDSEPEVPSQKIPNNPKQGSKIFGAYKFSTQKIHKLQKQDSDQTRYGLSEQPIVEQKITINPNKQHNSFNQELIRYYSYCNEEIINESHKGDMQRMNRIEYHLQNPNFFLPKLHVALDRQKEFSGMTNDSRTQGAANRNMQNVSQLNRSHISDSLFTGNRQQLSKPSEGNERMYPLLEDEQQQTIERRIKTEMRNIYKEPLHHSDVALKFELVKFTLEQNQFNLYHRYRYPYDLDFSLPTAIKPLYHKSRKLRPKDLILNTQMKNSNIKYSKKESLSLVEGEFILIENIEEHPLLISNVGMCERMFIQVNYEQLLEKINQDLISNAKIDDFEELRDNPQGHNDNPPNNPNNGSFQTKCELWRKNIRDTFGDNGKLFLWEPKNRGKLIGSPEGLGVAVMESNMANYPIVKKEPKYNRRDFLLVRDGNKWVLRRIEHIYVSGQVQPKKKIFNPDSRNYIDFKSFYEKAFMRRQIATYNSVNFDLIKNTFRGESESSLKKSLKGIRATSNDNKNYTIMEGFDNNEFQLTPEDVCMYQRMQKSICMLKDAGISNIRNNEKMKNVLKEFNKRFYEIHEKYAISRMIKDQLLLTSWYLTDSFSKFEQKSSKIQIVGMADPTNGRGGYSYINKPQKERTSKEDMDEKAEKHKVSGTTSDLRKLKTNETHSILISRGHSEQQLKGKGRWGLVELIRKQQDTEYARKQRETKGMKSENQKREISRVFNKMLSYLNDEQPAPAFKYNFKKSVTLAEILEKERPNWTKMREKYQRALNNQVVSPDEDQFEDQAD